MLESFPVCRMGLAPDAATHAGARAKENRIRQYGGNGVYIKVY